MKVPTNGDIERLCKELTEAEADEVLQNAVVQEYIRKYGKVEE